MAAKIFVSFKTADTARVRPVCEALRVRGFTVFWSNDIPAGSPNYQAIIKRELLDADAVVVVWTNESVHSGPVVQECAQAERLNKLFQLLLDDIQPIDMPMEVRFKAQKTMLFGWTGDTRHAEWLKLISALETAFRNKVLGQMVSPEVEMLRQAELPEFESASKVAAAIRADYEEQKENTKYLVEHLGMDTPGHLVGAVRVIVGSGSDDREQWIVPGSGKTVWFKDLSNGPEMVVIPQGGFFMGSVYYESEMPPHFVEFSRPFAVGRYPVLVSQLSEIMPGCQSLSGRDRREHALAAPVSWYDAQRFTERLSSITGKRYRLLSEAEWEYCADAGTWDDSVGWILNSKYQEIKAWSPGLIVNEPNDWGVTGLYQDFREWCRDDWCSNHVDAPLDGTSRQVATMRRKVVRGGLLFNGSLTRVEERSNAHPSDTKWYIGFRIARDLE